MMDDWARAEQMKAQGFRWATISRETGITTDRLRYRLDPRYRESRLTRQLEARQRSGKYQSPVRVSFGHVSPEEARRLLASIPKDTRGLTARICGDPLPGRSALDARHH